MAVQQRNANTATTAKTKRRQRMKSRGGPWRAYLHLNFQGVKITRENAPATRASYASMKRAQGPEWSKCKELGMLMNLAGKRGYKVRPHAYLLKRGSRKKHTKCPRLLHKISELKQESKAETEDRLMQEAHEDAIMHQRSSAVQEELGALHQIPISNIMSSAFLQTGESGGGDKVADSSKSAIAFPGSAICPAVLHYLVPADRVAKVSWPNKN